MVLPRPVIAGGDRLWQKAIPRLLIHSLIAGLDGTKNGPDKKRTFVCASSCIKQYVQPSYGCRGMPVVAEPFCYYYFITTNGPTRTSYRRGGPFMAVIIGPGGPFTAAKNGPGPFLVAVNGPPGPV